MSCLFQCCNRESRTKKELGDAFISGDLSVQLRDITVRIIHAGGREELYRYAIPASKLMEKYPGMCLARPQVFKNPHDSILSAEDKLFPGHKYYIIPSTTVEKLKRKHAKKCKERESTEGKEPVLDWQTDSDASGDFSEDSVCSAKEFYVSRERWSTYLLKKGQRGKKSFAPPIQAPKTWRGSDWEPSLTSIQEISP
ncbi:uncharacterized protein LOC130779366 [Actinidia eriantha]|uniref:uncharacterized protein LOC130779366 n=1 Tax=Actinidia eriantha TaxID=165200 RepID=UPI002584BDCB|nr:uncharacterized protein LOC130779366 [Actinidia eriantha]XP_057493956.1 uncharacterized protein LOC130779366 [Actinidia eriantha]